MRFDGKTNKQRATAIKIGELSGVTVPAVQGSVATMRKYATPETDEFQDLAKAVFSEVMETKAVEESTREMLEPLLDHLYRSQDALWDANRDAMKKGNAEEVKQNLREFAMSIMTLAKAAPSDPSAYAYAPDKEKPSGWKLRIDTPAHISAAAAALSPEGFRGNPVEIPAADRKAVVARVRAAWLKAYPDKSEADMPDSLKKVNDMPENVNVEELQALAVMTDAQKAHYATLSDDDKSAFVKMSADERTATVDLLKTTEETYTTSKGVSLVKSALPAGVFEMLKSQDEDLMKLRGEQELQGFVKTAEADYQYLPGTALAKAAVLRDVAKMDKGVAETLTAALKAGNAAMKPQFEQHATPGGDGMAKSAQEEFDGMVKVHAKEHNVTMAKATEAVMATDAGAKLYEQL